MLGASPKIRLSIIKYIISFQIFLIHDMLGSNISSFSLLLMTGNLGFCDAKIVGIQMVEQSLSILVPISPLSICAYGTLLNNPYVSIFPLSICARGTLLSFIFSTTHFGTLL